MTSSVSNAPLKVVFTMTFGERAGGAENYLWTFLRHIDRRRIDPFVLFYEDGPFEREVASLGLATAVVDPGRLRQAHRLAGTILRIARLLRRERPHLVVNWLTKAQIYGGPAAALAGMASRVVWWQHLVTRRDLLDRVATALPACAIGTSSASAAAAQAALWPHRPVFSVHPGIDPPQAADPRRLQELRDALDLPSGPVIGTVGRLQPLKHQDRVLRALALLRAAGKPAHALIVGGSAHGLDPDYEPCLRRLARELLVEDHVTFTGQVPDATAHMQLMDVLINACPTESFGISLIEAMALGTAVVAVEAPGPREILDGGVAGVLVPSNDVGAIACAVARVLDDPLGRARLVARGVKRYRMAFGAERMSKELEDRLISLAASGR